MTCVFQVPGTPVAKGRPRVFKRGAHVRAVTPDKTVRYEDKVAYFAKQEGVTRFDGLVSVIITACFEWPKTKWRKRAPRPSRYKGNGPDLDNIVKAVLDGLNGVAFGDDRQVVRIDARKIYVEQGQSAKTVIGISPVPDQILRT